MSVTADEQTNASVPLDAHTEDEAVSPPKACGDKFHATLAEMMLNCQAHNSSAANIYIVNDFIVPVTSSAASSYGCGFMKIRFGIAESEYMRMNVRARALANHAGRRSVAAVSSVTDDTIKNEPGASSSSGCDGNEPMDRAALAAEIRQLELDKYLIADFDEPSQTTSQPAAQKAQQATYFNKPHLHILFAFNRLGHISVPLLTLPRSELESNLSEACGQARKVLDTLVCSETNANGDLNSLALFNKVLFLSLNN